MSSDPSGGNAPRRKQGAKAPAKPSAKAAGGTPARGGSKKKAGKSAAKAPPKPVDRTRLRDPRGRMVEAMLALVGEQGYCDTTVAHVIARAEASRKTFYEHFEDIESCFLAVADEVVRQWTEAAVQAFEAHLEPGDAMEALVERLFASALESPAGLRLLTAELLAGGQEGVGRRERAMGRLGELVNTALIGLAEADSDRARRPEPKDDSPVGRVLAGAVLRIAYVRARRGAGVRKPRRTELNALVVDVARWVAQYRWAPDPGEGAVSDDGLVPPVGGRAPGTLSLDWRASERRGLPRGESNVSHSFVVHSQRERLLDALANLSAAKGYDRVTIPEIVSEAAVSVQAFYEHFSGKEDSFLVAHEVGSRKQLAIMERAYEAQADWPSAMRAAVGAMLDFYASEPSFAHLALVDAATAGTRAMELSRNVGAACGDLIRPGIQYNQDGVQRPAIMVEGAVHGLMELGCMYAAAERARELPGALDMAVHIALDPFLGAGAAETHARISQAASHAVA